MNTGGPREESLPSLKNGLTAQMKDGPPVSYTLNEANLASLALDNKKGTKGFVQVDILEPVK